MYRLLGPAARSMGILDKIKGSATPSKATDPVCGMQVEPSKAAGKSSHGAQTYYFCSASCKQKFDADPHRYLGAHAH
jgi:Cu+-exporting ATPase